MGYSWDGGSGRGPSGCQGCFDGIVITIVVIIILILLYMALGR